MSPAERETPAGEAMREAVAREIDPGAWRWRDYLVGCATHQKVVSEYQQSFVLAYDAGCRTGDDFDRYCRGMWPGHKFIAVYAARLDTSLVLATAILAGPIASELARLTAERDEAREAVALCNNSFGSYSYHLKPHPAEQIEKIKQQARSEWQRAEAAEAALTTQRAATPPEDRQTGTGWPDISTAPRDGTWFLGIDDSASIRNVRWTRWWAPSGRTQEWLCHEAPGSWSPTHWNVGPNPLPPAIGNLEGESRS